ncbi:MAG: putative Ig domain-containing protein, partial [bacterium]
FNPTIIVTDSCVLGSRSDSVEFPFTIYEETPECADPPSITNSPDDGSEGSPYSFQFMADFGELPLTWEIISGAPPYMLTLSTDGLLSGDIECGETGEFEFTVQVTDSCETPQSDVQFVLMNVTPQQCDLLDINDNQIVPEAMETIPYFYPIEYTGGYGLLTWELISGTLPSGLNFADGVITGIPGVESTGDYPLLIQVTDSCCTPQVDTFEFTFTVVPLSPCLQEPVEVHTFCLDCPEIIPIDVTAIIPLYLVPPPMSVQFPFTIEINLTYDETLVTVDEILPGPILNNPSGFGFVVNTSDFTITYNGPPPITRQGIFAYILMSNINISSTSSFIPVEEVIVFADELGEPLNYNTSMCSIMVEGVD